MSQGPIRPIAELAKLLAEQVGINFADHQLLLRAMTHSSARSASGSDYERLEFLGDRVLGLIIADMLFDHHRDADQGELSVRLHALVETEACADVADQIGLHEFIVTGSDIKSLTGPKSQNLRADVIEALIAAIFLDSGIEAARKFVLNYWEPRSKQVATARRDAKTELQEWAHRIGAAPPVYSIDSRNGPDHDPTFTVGVKVDGVDDGQGVGRSKREAERAAASQILYREGVWQAQENQQ